MAEYVGRVVVVCANFGGVRMLHLRVMSTYILYCGQGKPASWFSL